MDHVYIVWLINKKTKNSMIAKIFYDSEKALNYKKELEIQNAHLGEALTYDVVLEYKEVWS